MLGSDMLGTALLGGSLSGGAGGGSSSSAMVGDFFVGADMLGGGPGVGDGGGGGGGIDGYGGRIEAGAEVVAGFEVHRLQSITGTPSGHASVSGSVIQSIALYATITVSSLQMVSGRLGLEISDLSGLIDGDVVVAADLGQHLLQGGQADGEATVTEQFTLEVALDPSAIEGFSTVSNTDLGVTIWIAGSPAGDSTVTSEVGLIIDDLVGDPAGETAFAGNFDIYTIPPQPIIAGVEEIFATLNLEGDFGGFPMGEASLVVDPDVIYVLEASTSDGDTVLDANLTRWVELSGGTSNGDAVVEDTALIVYMLSGGLIEGESDVAARLYYAEGFVPLYAKPTGEATAVGHMKMRSFMRHDPIVAGATIVATLYYLEELEGAAEASSTVTTTDFDIYTIPPTPIITGSEVIAHLEGVYGYRGEMEGSSTVTLTVPLLMETFFFPGPIHGETTVTTGLFYIEPHDLMVQRINCSTTFERVNLHRGVWMNARPKGESIVARAPLGKPIVIGIYTVDFARGESTVTVTQLIVNMGGQSNGDNRGNGDLFVLKHSDLPGAISQGSSTLGPVDLWPRGWLEPEPSNGFTGVGTYKPDGVNVHPFYGSKTKQLGGYTPAAIQAWNRAPGYFVDSDLFHTVALYATTSTEDDYYKVEHGGSGWWNNYSPESAWIVPDDLSRPHRYCGARFVSTLDGSNSVDLFVELKNALYGHPSGASSVIAEFIVLKFRTMMVEGNVARVGDRTRVHSGIVSKSGQPHIPLSQRRNVELDDQRHPVPLFT